MFTCCHPALNLDAQVALTLRSLAGLSTADIARAFLVSERTMGQRIFRAKQKVAHAVIPFRVPPAHLLPDRLPAVLHVLYLLFNEGYSDQQDKARLSTEAIRLARVLASLMPDEPEAQGLLALMLLQEARQATRLDADGELVTLEHQDRSRWDRDRIDEGHRDPGACAAPSPRGTVPDPGGDRSVPRDRAVPRGDGLAADRRALRSAAAGAPEPVGRPEQGCRGGDGSGA